MLRTSNAIRLTTALLAASLAARANATAVLDDELQVSFATSGQSGMEDGEDLSVDIVLSAEHDADVTVPLLVSGTATDEDFEVTVDEVTIPAGSTSVALTIELRDDELDEGNETVVLTLGDQEAVALGATKVHVVTIQDEDPLPTIAFSSAGASAAEDGDEVEITVRLSAVSGRDVTVPITLGGDATNGADYETQDEAVVIEAGSRTASFRITLLDDEVDEPDESIEIGLGEPVNAGLGPVPVQIVTVVDDDASPSVVLDRGSSTVDELTGSLTLTLVLSEVSERDVTVPYTVSGDDEDFSAQSGPAFIPAGESSVDISVTIVDDTLDEDEETLRITLGTPKNATLGATIRHTATIVDDDSPPDVDFAIPFQVLDESASSVSVTVTLSAASGKDVSVPFTVAGTALDPEDYALAATSLTILAGETSGSIDLTVVDDTRNENDESLEISLQTPTNAMLGSSTLYSATLQDDDVPPTVEFVTISQSANEDAGQVPITVTLSSVSGLDVSIPYHVSGTASDPDDYSVDAGPLLIPAGEISADILVHVADDTMYELAENIELVLGTPVNGTLKAKSIHLFTINSNDPVPTVEFTSPGQTAGEGTGAALATLTLSTVAGVDVTVPILVSGGAAEGVDFSLDQNPVVIPQGLLTADLGVTLLADALYEGNEDAVLTLDQPTGADLGIVIVHTLTIADDEGPPSVTFTANRTFTDEAVGVVPIVAELSEVSGLDVTLPYTDTGSATPGADYTIDASPLVIQAGQTQGSIFLTVIDDSEDEYTERVLVKMGASPTNATLGAITRHRVNIQDDDGIGTEKDVVGLRANILQNSFPTTRVGEASPPVTIQLTNTNHIPVEFRGMALEGGDDDDFDATYPGSLPVVLAPGQSTTVDLTFLPTLHGPRDAQARVRQKPAGAPPGLVLVDGIGIGPTGAEILVNAAPDEFVDGKSQTWVADYGFAGTSWHISTSDGIAGTTDDPLYRTARIGGVFSYAFELPNGVYDVILHAAEIEKNATGQRVFDVLAEGQPWIDDLDLFVAVGADAAYVTAPQSVTVSDGTLDLDFIRETGEALACAIEIRSKPVLVPDATVLDFGIVEQGDFVEKVLSIENVGLVDTAAKRLAFLMDGSPKGTGADFYVRYNNVDYYGGVSSIYYNVNIPFPAGQTVQISVFFEPTQHEVNEIQLGFSGATEFPDFEVDLIGVGGADPGWGYLHPVLDTDRPLYVDFDDNLREDLTLLGMESHTHEPGHVLTTYEWTIDSVVVGTEADIVVPQVPVGSHTVGLTIGDDNAPQSTASDTMPFTIHPLDQVPGSLCSYYDGSVGGASALLDNVPTKAQYIERLSALHVDAQNGFVGSSPFATDVMVQWQARFDVASVAMYDIVPVGGVDTRVEVNGNAWTVQNLLFPGTYDLEIRFAVDTIANLPLDLQVFVDSVLDTGFDDALVHDEDGIKPVIHEMPSVGNELGGNLITISGFGFYPKDTITVHWGPNFDLTEQDFVSWTDEVIEFLSPAGTGTINVRVQTSNGLSDPRSFTYDNDGPVPISFIRLDDRKISLPAPTTAVFHPNGKLYVGMLGGKIAEIELDEHWWVTGTGIVIHDGISNLTNSDLLGICVNPYDDPAGPVKLYVAHGEHFLNGGGSFSGPSPYTGQVSVLTGPDLEFPTTLLDGLPTSNHDHAVNGILFDNNGDLLICIGSNTNAGVKYPNIGDLDESPLAAAVVKARTSLGPRFNGNVVYLNRSNGAPNDDQVFGESVDVAPGIDVEVWASGTRNPYDITLTTWGYYYTTDNGPNWNFGFASTGPNTDSGSHPQDTDEINLTEAGGYYGHPNRNRGFHDYRQYVYRDGNDPSDAEFTQRVYEVDSSTNGIEEYRADTFKGQIRGRLLAQKWNDNQYLLELTPDKRGVIDDIELIPFTKGLDVVTGKGGTILAIDYSGNAVQFMEPDDLAVIGLTIYDIYPWRAMAAGGTPFTIGGENFVNGQTVVTIDGVPATLTEVTPRRIKGIFPALPTNNIGGLYDVVVTVAADTDTLTEAVLILPDQPGEMNGFWTTATSMPDELGEVACGIVGTQLYLFGEGTGKTYAYDLLSGAWADNLALRPYGGNHHACEVIDGKVYLFGGLGFSSEGEVQIYDPQADSWSSGTQMPWAGGSCNSAVIDGLVYVCGGIVGNSTVNNLSVYDPVTDLWDVVNSQAVNLAAMATPVNHAASGTDGSRLWVFGGRQGGNSVQVGFDTVQWYDPGTDTWESSDGPSSLTPMPDGRGGTGKALYYEGEFYVFGGEAPNTIYDDTFVYDPVGNSWRSDEPMPTPRHGVFPVRFMSRIHLAGGGVVAGFSASDVLEVFQRP